jgi:hypothetical protein
VKLSEFGYHRAKRGDIGIEIEVEGEEILPTVDSDWWTSKKEDSLRHYGMEYVTTRPLKSGQEVKDAVEYVCKIINKKKIVKNTNRTSIHTHHNMTKHDLKDIITGICIFWIVENVLARYCGEDRESNLFCMRLKDAEAVLDEVIKTLGQPVPFMDLGDKVRYAGLNIGALKTYGSLEVRLKQGTTDPEEIVEWAENMHQLFNTHTWKDPSDFFEWYIQKGSDKLLQGIFAEKFYLKLKDRVPNYKNLMEENAILVSELAYAKDWNEWSANLEKNKGEDKLKSPPKQLQPTDINYWSQQANANPGIYYTISNTGMISDV